MGSLKCQMIISFIFSFGGCFFICPVAIFWWVRKLSVRGTCWVNKWCLSSQNRINAYISSSSWRCWPLCSFWVFPLLCLSWRHLLWFSSCISHIPSESSSPSLVLCPSVKQILVFYPSDLVLFFICMVFLSHTQHFYLHSTWGTSNPVSSLKPQSSGLIYPAVYSTWSFHEHLDLSISKIELIWYFPQIVFFPKSSLTEERHWHPG